MKSVPNSAQREDAFTLQTLTAVDAAGGAVTRSWGNVVGDDATRRGELVAKTSRQIFEAAQTKFQATHELRTRFVPSLVDVVDLTLFRWTRGSLVYNIGHVENMNNRRQVTVCHVTVSSVTP